MDNTERALTTLAFSGISITISSKNHVALQSFLVDHIHPVPEMHICLSGTGALYTSSGKTDLHKGDCILIGPNTLHHFEIKPKTAMARLEALLHVDRHRALPDRYEWLWQENTVNIWKLEDLYFSLGNLIANEIRSKSFDYENVVNNSYLLLFTHLARISGNNAALTPLPSDPGQNRSVEERYTRDSLDNYLLLHYGNNISVEDLAKHLDVSTRHAHRLVKHYTGQTFMQYLTFIRMANAKQLLNNTDLPVYQIAEKVGYKYSSNFCKAFCQQNMMTPEAYRKWIRQERDEDQSRAE